ncbi:hypothetical protein SDJN03_00413, partial [Cucurbita argyrosperma subsp. sororia]
MGHSSNSGGVMAAAAMGVFILVLSGSDCNVASPTPSSYGNNTVAAAASMWCDGRVEECVTREGDSASAFPSLQTSTRKYISPSSVNSNKAVCERPDEYRSCFNPRRSNPNPNNCGRYTRVC